MDIHSILVISGPAALIAIFVFGLLVLFPFIYYMLTLQSVLKEISPENRKMQPEQVWLSFIPIFGMIWQYYIVARLADSLKLELRKRNIWSDEKRPGYRVGLSFCRLLSSSIIPYFGLLTTIGGLVCWILYWLRINEYRSRLIENPLNYLHE